MFTHMIIKPERILTLGIAVLLETAFGAGQGAWRSVRSHKNTPAVKDVMDVVCVAIEMTSYMVVAWVVADFLVSACEANHHMVEYVRRKTLREFDGRDAW